MSHRLALATAMALLSVSHAMSAPACKTSDSLDVLRDKLVVMAAKKIDKSGVPGECFDQALYIFDNIARSNRKVTDIEFYKIVSSSIIIDTDDGESDGARSVDKIIHTNLSHLRPLFRIYAAKIDNKCTRLEYISHIEGMDCQVEHPFNAGTENAFCNKYYQEHRPSTELVNCRKQK